jgi:hypothetical protein
VSSFLVIHMELEARLATVLAIGLILGACSARQNASEASNAAVRLQAIPAADAAKYERIRNMKNWRNPYLIIRTDGVGLLDPADNAEIILKPDDLLGALARLPASAWPYGRVVAASENAIRSSEQDGVAIRRNKGIVGGILQGAHVAVDWVPSA